MTNDAVKLIECPRDAWQGLSRQIPTELKVRYLGALITAGFKHIDAVSFVSPKAVPQMADSETVLAQLAPPNDVEIIGIVVNEKGAERALASGAVTTLGFPFSVSETFLRKNQKQTPNENLEVLQNVKRLADEAGRNLVVYISMAFGNPYDDEWSEVHTAEAAKRIADLGVTAISLADTVGVANAGLIARVVTTLLREVETAEIGVHLHSTRTDAAEKVFAAYDVGCCRFDSALGGLGGCPFAQNALVGNLPTEEVLRALSQRGVKTPSNETLRNVELLNAEIEEKFSA